CPGFEITRELCVGHNVNCFNFSDAAEVIDDPCEHRFSGDIQKRFRLVQGEGMQACGITRGENQNIHQAGTVNGDELRASEWSAAKCRRVQLPVQGIHSLGPCEFAA